VGVSRFRPADAESRLECVPRFLVESYVAASPSAFEDACQRARRTAEAGIGVRYVDTTYVPGDETVLHLFDAPSADVLEEAGTRSGLAFERIVPAVNDPTGERKENQDAKA
jgi:hypothetical protein